MRYKISLSLTLLLIFLLPAHAFSKAYFPGDAISPELLEKPIKPGSPDWKSEISKIKNLQKDASKGDLMVAAEEIDLKPETMVMQLADNVTREKHPEVFHLLDRVEDTAIAVSDNSKQFWKTKRPYIADKTIKPLIKPAKGYAYPSQHATVSYLLAQVLGQLMPEKRKLFMKRADDMATHRILAGMHFQQDIIAGKNLSRLIFNKLQNNATFIDDLATARIDINK